MLTRAMTLLAVFATLQTAAADEADVPQSPIDGLEAMEWEWAPEEVRSFYVESVVLYDSPVYLQGKRNIEVRATQIETKFVTTCVTVEQGKQRWQHTCTIDDISLIGIALRENEDDDMADMLQQMDDSLTGASVQVRQRRSGKLVGFDLQGVDKSNREMASVHEVMRTLLRQGFSGLDIEFRDVLADNMWIQSSTRLVELIASNGAVPVVHRIAESQDNRMVITSFGKGTMGTYDVRLSGDALFNNNKGTLMYRSWKVKGTQRLLLGEQQPTANTGWIAALGTGSPRPNVGESGLWHEHAVRDTAITLMDVLMSSE